jgi:hypothetical protein
VKEIVIHGVSRSTFWMNLPQIGVTKGACRVLGTLAIAVFCTTSVAATINIAPLGSGQSGVNTALDSTYGTSVFNSGTAAMINDGLINNGVDTFSTANPAATVSFVGITWAAPRTDQIISLTLTMETFFDGGWFGPNGQSPGSGGTLNPSFLTNPPVQFSISANPASASGVWTNAAATSNYLTVLNGHVIGTNGGTNPTVPPAATWTLSAPLTGVTGIRLIGSEGGAAGTQGGFIGIRELTVEAVPEPAATSLLLAGGLFLARRRRRVA